MGLLDLVRKSKLQSSAELRATIAAISIDEAERAVNDLEMARSKALIEGTDSDIERIESQLITANREVERTIAVINDLTLRVADAEKTEVLGRVQAAINAANVAQKAGAKALFEVDKHAAALAEAIQSYNNCEKIIQASNELAVEHGMKDALIATPMAKLSTSLNRAVVNTFWMPNYQPPEIRLGSRMTCDLASYQASRRHLNKIKQVEL